MRESISGCSVLCYTVGMTVLTIPKKMAKEDIVLISRGEYETLLSRAQEVRMAPDEKRALIRARKNLKAGKLLSLYEFSRKLGIKNRR